MKQQLFAAIFGYFNFYFVVSRIFVILFGMRVLKTENDCESANKNSFDKNPGIEKKLFKPKHKDAKIKNLYQFFLILPKQVLIIIKLFLCIQWRLWFKVEQNLLCFLSIYHILLFMHWGKIIWKGCVKCGTAHHRREWEEFKFGRGATEKLFSISPYRLAACRSPISSKTAKL